MFKFNLLELTTHTKDFYKIASKSELEIGKFISQFENLTLFEYFRHIAVNCKSKRNAYFTIFVSELKTYLEKINTTGIEEIIINFNQLPILQTADHSNLLLDTETFLNNYLFKLFCEVNGISTMLIHQSSNINCIGGRNPLTGPVFLYTRNRAFKIFNYSNSWFKNRIFSTIISQLKINLHEINSRHKPIKIDSILLALEVESYSSSVDAIRISNDFLWNSFKSKFKTKRIGLDNSFCQLLLIRYLEASDNPIYILLFNKIIRSKFCEIKSLMIREEKYSMISNSELDFFWYIRGGRSYPLKYYSKNNIDCLVNLELDVRINFIPQEIINLLKNGIILPDQFLIFFSRHILPCVFALGACRQQDYIIFYKKLILKTNENVQFLNEECETQIRATNLSFLGGAPLLELNQDIFSFIQYLNEMSNLDFLKENILEMKLKTLMGKFNWAENYLRDLLKRSIYV